jgi:hypothetical protein
MSTGTVSILNVGAGDIELRFDKSNPSESIRAGRIIEDMLRRGYALLVEVERDGEKRFERAQGFDLASNSYIIADFDPVRAALSDAQAQSEAELDRAIMHRQMEKEQKHGESQPAEKTPPAPGDEQSPRKRGRPAKRAIPADKTRAVAVGRSAGG